MFFIIFIKNLKLGLVDYANVLVSVRGRGGVKTLSMLHRGMVNVDFIVDKVVMVRKHEVLDLI